MIIRNVKKSGSAGAPQELTATVIFERPQRRAFDLYFRFEDAPFEITSAADPFLVGCLCAAMISGEDLEVQGPVDPELVARIEGDIIPLLRGWFPSLAGIELRCGDLQPPDARSCTPGGATGFSGGLDALYTVVRHRDKLNWLVAAQGFDIRTFQKLAWPRMLDDIRAAARPFGLPVIAACTNVREISHFELIRGFNGRVHPEVYKLGPNGPIGPFMAALGRCVLPSCDRFLISSGVPYDKLYPFGSHPLFDPMWSTSAQEVRHIGCEYCRIEKIRYLKQTHPESLNRMRVCWTPPAGRPNCSRCEKCVRTMAQVRLAGAESCAAAFDWPLEFDRIRRLKLRYNQIHYWQTLAEEAAARDDSALASAARAALGRRLPLAGLWRRAFARQIANRKARAEWTRLQRVMQPSRGKARA